MPCGLDGGLAELGAKPTSSRVTALGAGTGVGGCEEAEHGAPLAGAGACALRPRATCAGVWPGARAGSQPLSRRPAWPSRCGGGSLAAAQPGWPPTPCFVRRVWNVLGRGAQLPGETLVPSSPRWLSPVPAQGSAGSQPPEAANPCPAGSFPALAAGSTASGSWGAPWGGGGAGPGPALSWFSAQCPPAASHHRLLCP